MQKILFIHRSVGRNLIKYGHVYKLMEPYKQAFSFADYDHNNGVLRAAHSHKKLGYVFPGRNTYPHDLAVLFSKPTAETQPILDWINEYDVVVLKSCYPTTKIKTDQELEQLKQDYRHIAAYFHKSGQKLGLLTPPPMKPRLTKPAWADRARQLADWLTSHDFGSHVKVFDLFDALSAGEDDAEANCLRKEYRRFLFFDAHPNRRANLAIAPQFVAWVASIAGLNHR